MINMALAERVGLSAQSIYDIEDLHKGLACILREPKRFSRSPAHAVQQIESYEYALQEVWGFPQSKNHHRYWHRVKGCTCGGMDSDEMIPSGMRSVNMGCMFHGNDVRGSWDD